jgi:hypothetical protein
MCIQQETLYACGHKVTIPMVIFAGNTNKCPCLEIMYVDSRDECRRCEEKERKKMFRATNPRAEVDDDVILESGGKKGEGEGEPLGSEGKERGEEEDEKYQLICGKCRRRDCGRCACCKGGKARK